MALALDNSAVATQVGAGSTSLTWSHTCAGSDRILIVALNGGVDPTGVTYAGDAMTEVSTGYSSAHGGVLSMWYKIAPATGANDIVASFSSSDMAGASVSYTGALQSSQPDASTTGEGGNSSTYAQSLTTLTDNCWVVWLASNNQGTPNVAAGANTTLRQNNNGGSTSRSFGLLDTNGAVTPAGSRTLNASGSTGLWAGFPVSIKPAAAASTFIPYIIND